MFGLDGNKVLLRVEEGYLAYKNPFSVFKGLLGVSKIRFQPNLTVIA